MFNIGPFTVKPTKRLGLSYYGVFYKGHLIKTAMSESGAVSIAKQLDNSINYKLNQKSA